MDNSYREQQGSLWAKELLGKVCVNIDRLQNMNTIHPHQKDQVRKLAYLHVIAYQHREKQPHLHARLLDEAPRNDIMILPSVRWTSHSVMECR